MTRFNKYKNFIFEQIEKFVQFNGIGIPVMLVMNLTVGLLPYIEQRSFHPYLGFPLVFSTIFILYWTTAHIVVRKGGTYINRSRAAIKYNQYSVWAIPPFQHMMIQHVWLPVLKQSDLSKAEMVENWLRLGYIPKEDFPDELKEFYIAKEGSR